MIVTPVYEVLIPVLIIPLKKKGSSWDWRLDTERTDIKDELSSIQRNSTNMTICGYKGLWILFDNRCKCGKLWGQ